MNTTAVCGFDLTGRMLWRQSFPGRPYPPRLTAENVWIPHHGSFGRFVVSAVNTAGKRVNTVMLERVPFEDLGAFVLLPDGFVALWLPAVPGHVLPRNQFGHLARWLPTERGRTTPRRRDARLVRYDEAGGTRWSISLPLRELFVPGAVVITVKTGKERPSPPLRPRTLEAGYPDPLLVSGSRVAATVADYSTGIAVTFFVDTETGQLIDETVPGPSHNKAIVGPEKFLIGFAGYGEVMTAQCDATGAVTRLWPTHAQMLVDNEGVISGPESENVLPSRSQFVRFGSDGGVQRGPPLSGYYTTYPALDSDGTAVFWRDGALRAVDADLRVRELHSTRHGQHAVPSRVLLLEDGHVVFALNDELLILREPGLRKLSDGIWPCGDGGLRGNPVKFCRSA
ncbi:hypothetical protein ACFQWH_26810 [Mycolicibacterium sp. GCM10028919]|uniref:hypothetical protein n=1 Tax=Mycolicibacterium sp. GCM10028919 TaxID=3273401 RepID=UPI0036209B19